MPKLKVNPPDVLSSLFSVELLEPKNEKPELKESWTGWLFCPPKSPPEELKLLSPGNVAARPKEKLC